MTRETRISHGFPCAAVPYSGWVCGSCTNGTDRTDYMYLSPGSLCREITLQIWSSVRFPLFHVLHANPPHGYPFRSVQFSVPAVSALFHTLLERRP